MCPNVTIEKVEFEPKFLLHKCYSVLFLYDIDELKTCRIKYMYIYILDVLLRKGAYSR